MYWHQIRWIQLDSNQKSKNLEWFPSPRDIAMFCFINILQFIPEAGNLPNWYESDPDSSGQQQNILWFVAENESCWKWTALVQIHISSYNIAS